MQVTMGSLEWNTTRSFQVPGTLLQIAKNRNLGRVSGTWETRGEFGSQEPVNPDIPISEVAQPIR